MVKVTKEVKVIMELTEVEAINLRILTADQINEIAKEVNQALLKI